MIWIEWQKLRWHFHEGKSLLKWKFWLNFIKCDEIRWNSLNSARNAIKNVKFSPKIQSSPQKEVRIVKLAQKLRSKLLKTHQQQTISLATRTLADKSWPKWNERLAIWKCNRDVCIVAFSTIYRKMVKNWWKLHWKRQRNTKILAFKHKIENAIETTFRYFEHCFFSISTFSLRYNSSYHRFRFVRLALTHGPGMGHLLSLLNRNKCI